jgi:hypothetical protein
MQESIRQPRGETSQRIAGATRRRFEPLSRTVDERHRDSKQRLADAHRRALVSAWLRALSRGE